MHIAIKEAAERLLQAHDSKTPCQPVRELISKALCDDPDKDAIALAYSVQDINIKKALKAGRRIVGRKIGITSSAVQKQLGVDQPDFGTLLDDMIYANGQPIPWSTVLQPRVEAEIVFVLEKDLTHERHTVVDLMRAIAFALPAIEVVGSRIANWDIQLVDTISDNASCGQLVLGTQPVQLSKLDLINCGMCMNLNGEPVSVGVGAACLGNPLNALAWLADMMVQVGQPLRAGDVVLTGALGAMVVAEKHHVFKAEIQGLGNVSVAFS